MICASVRATAAGILVPPVASTGIAGSSPPAPPVPKANPPTPLAIPVKTGFSFTKKSLKTLILVTSYQRKSPDLVMNTL